MPQNLQASAYENLGTSYRYLGKYDKALENFECGYELARKQRNIAEIVRALNGRSKMQALRGEYGEALALNTEAISYLALPNTYDKPEVLVYNRALILRLQWRQEDREEYRSTLEKMRQHEYGPEMLELWTRDATEFDLKKHPELADVFEFCKTLPRKTTVGSLLIEEALTSRFIREGLKSKRSRRPAWTRGPSILLSDPAARLAGQPKTKYSNCAL